MVKKNNFLSSLNLFNNKSGKKSYNGILIIAGILGVLFLLSLVPATLGHKVAIIGLNGSGSTVPIDNITISEDKQVKINITLNVSNGYIAAADTLFPQMRINISAINITLPLSINFTDGTTNFSGGANSTTNTTFDLTKSGLHETAWLRNDTRNKLSIQTRAGGLETSYTSLVSLDNGSTTQATLQSNYSWIVFNITGYVPGSYVINVSISNTTVGATQQAISNMVNITVNDTTAPDRITLNANSTGFSGVTYGYRGLTSTKVNLSSKNQVQTIFVSINVSDFNETGAGGVGYAGQAIMSANISLYNISGLINSTIVSKGTGVNVATIDFNFTKGSNNVDNFTDGNYWVNVTSVQDIGGNINYTGLAYNITIDGTDPTLTVAKAGTSTSKQIVLDITLSDATSGIQGKQCTVTGGGVGGIVMSGNTGTQTATQTDLGCNTAYTYTTACTDHSGNTKSISTTVNTDACVGGGTSGTSGGTGGSDVVGSASSAFWILTYNEATTDLNGDSDGVSSLLLERYRVKIKVDTKLYYVGVVDTTDTTAKINVTTTARDKEEMFNIGDVKKFDVNADNKYDLSVTLNGIDSATGKADLSLVYIQEEVPAEEQKEVEEQVGEGTTSTSAKSKAWIWIIVVLAVLAIAGAILFGKKQSRHKNYGF